MVVFASTSHADAGPMRAKPDVLALEVSGLSAGYGKRQVLNKVSLSVRPGEVVAVLGHNGAGKSTLLRAILGTIRQRTGVVRFFGRDISSDPYFKNVAAGISHSLAETPVFGALDVETNLRLGGYTQPNKNIARLTEQVYVTFPKLMDRRGQAAGTLSGGERRMLAIGMAIMNAPRLMLLDEPSIGLAPATAHQILGQIGQLCREQSMAVVIVDQSVRATLRIATEVYYLRMGQVLLSETAEAAQKREHYWDLF
jgi:branched-chain amino acid transport system ATP-binding protein